jgi:hypothetical protein
MSSHKKNLSEPASEDDFPTKLIGVVPFCHLPTIKAIMMGGVDSRIFKFDSKYSWKRIDLIEEALNLGVKIHLGLGDIMENVTRCHHKNQQVIIDYIELFVRRSLFDITNQKDAGRLFDAYMEYEEPSKLVIQYMLDNFEIKWNRYRLMYMTFANDPAMFDIARQKSGISDTMTLMALCDTMYSGFDQYIDFISFSSNFTFDIDSKKFIKGISSNIFNIKEDEFRHLIKLGVDFTEHQDVVLLELCRTNVRHTILSVLNEHGFDFAPEDDLFIKYNCGVNTQVYKDIKKKN